MQSPPRIGTQSVVEIALSYLRAGLSVIPIMRDGTKAAAMKWGIHGAGRKDEATGTIVEPARLMTEEEARRHFSGVRPPGIAVATGRVSGNLELIDFDHKADSTVLEWTFLVQSECPGLTDRLTQNKTPRSDHARHFWYRCPGAIIPGNIKLAEETHTMIETRGEGGYALVPGCPPECHDTGRLYVHVAGPSLLQVPTINVEERSILWRCARMFDLKMKEAEADARALANGVLMPGTDFIARGPDWAALLEPHGWVCARTCGGVRYWRRPGKDKGISGTTGVCVSKNGTPLFAVFSSNAPPFSAGENGKSCSCYSKFAVYTLLNHGGNFKVSADALRKDGFGSCGPVHAGTSAIEEVKQEQETAKIDKEEAERRLLEAKEKEKKLVKEKKETEKKEHEEKIRIGFSALGFEFVNGEWIPGGWRVTIIRSDPITFKLFAPFLAKPILLSDDQFDSPSLVHKAVLKATGNICLADRPQAWDCLWNGYKNIRAMKAKLLDTADEQDAPAEVKRSVVVAQWLLKSLQYGRQVKDRSEIDGNSGAYKLEDGSIVFDFTYIWANGSKSEDAIKRPEMSRLLEELGRDHCWRGKKMFDVLNKDALEKLESIVKPDQQPK